MDCPFANWPCPSESCSCDLHKFSSLPKFVVRPVLHLSLISHTGLVHQLSAWMEISFGSVNCNRRGLQSISAIAVHRIYPQTRMESSGIWHRHGVSCRWLFHRCFWSDTASRVAATDSSLGDAWRRAGNLHCERVVFRNFALPLSR